MRQKRLWLCYCKRSTAIAGGYLFCDAATLHYFITFLIIFHCEVSCGCQWPTSVLCTVPASELSVSVCLSVTGIVLSASALWLDYCALYKYSYLPSVPWSVPASELSVYLSVTSIVVSAKPAMVCPSQ